MLFKVQKTFSGEPLINSCAHILFELLLSYVHQNAHSEMDLHSDRLKTH